MKKKNYFEKNDISILIFVISLNAILKIYPLGGGREKFELQNYLSGDRRKPCLLILNFSFLSFLSPVLLKKEAERVTVY